MDEPGPDGKIHFRCECGRGLKARVEIGGKQAKCPCGRLVWIPIASAWPQEDGSVVHTPMRPTVDENGEVRRDSGGFIVGHYKGKRIFERAPDGIHVDWN
jgi:hypothetical protein